MTLSDLRTEHWQTVYAIKDEQDVSWFQKSPDVSLELIGRALPMAMARAFVIDIGGGASRLADALLDTGGYHVSVLDLSSAALETARHRIGPRAEEIDWIVADITEWRPPRRYDVWHDRAALHFLTEAADQVAYASALSEALESGGVAIIGTFAPDGPERCSGLQVMRHDEKSLGELLGDGFSLEDSRRHEHVTPWGSVQKFQFSSFRKAR
jgi:SAM-dependent methyltransferase